MFLLGYLLVLWGRHYVLFSGNCSSISHCRWLRWCLQKSLARFRSRKVVLVASVNGNHIMNLQGLRVEWICLWFLY